MPVREGGDEGEALLDQQAETKQHQKVNSRQNQTVSTQQFLRPDDAGVKVAPVATFKKRGGAGQCRNFRRRGRPGFEGGDTKAAAPPGTATDKERDDSDKARGNSGGDDGTKPGNGEIETVDTANDEKDVEQSPSCKGEEGEDENDDDEEEEGGSRMDILADLREEQRARRKGGGRSVSALMGSRRAKVEKQALVIKGHGVDGVVAPAKAVESFGLKVPEASAPNISSMIQSQFKSGGTGGWGAAADSAGAVPHEQLMEQYVNEKMGDSGTAGDDEEEGEGQGGGRGMLSEEDRLYTIPEEFKRKVEEAKREFDTGANRDGEMEGEVGSGAQIAWNTGLAEIALPIEFKLKNMEDTLAAREKLEQTRAARRNAPGESSSLTGSLTANYSHHQKEWAMQIRALQHRQQMAEESQTKIPAKSGPGMAASVALAGGAASSAGGGRGAGRGGRDDGGRGGGGGGGRGNMGPGGVRLKHSSDNAVLERFKKRTRRF